MDIVHLSNYMVKMECWRFKNKIVVCSNTLCPGQGVTPTQSEMSAILSDQIQQTP